MSLDLQSNRKVRLNVGGVFYETMLSTLTKYPDSMLGAMFSGRHAVHVEEDGAVFIDRDGPSFKHILNFLRNPGWNAEAIAGREFVELYQEADYFGLKDWMFPEKQFTGIDCDREVKTFRAKLNEQGFYSIVDYGNDAEPVYRCRCGKVYFHCAGYHSLEIPLKGHLCPSVHFIAKDLCSLKYSCR